MDANGSVLFTEQTEQREMILSPGSGDYKWKGTDDETDAGNSMQREWVWGLFGVENGE